MRVETVEIDDTFLQSLPSSECKVEPIYKRSKDFFPRVNPKKGSRKHRRWEHLQNLLDFNESIGVDDEEEFVIGHSLIPSFPWSEEWESFLQLNEQQQLVELKKVEFQNHRLPVKETFCASHPEHAFFSRINRKIRTAYRTNRIPMGFVEKMEDDIIDLFGVDDDTVIILTLDNPFERLLLHGICQYYNLQSRSETIDSKRQTVIENSLPSFKLPPMTLCDYLVTYHIVRSDNETI